MKKIILELANELKINLTEQELNDLVIIFNQFNDFFSIFEHILKWYQSEEELSFPFQYDQTFLRDDNQLIKDNKKMLEIIYKNSSNLIKINDNYYFEIPKVIKENEDN